MGCKKKCTQITQEDCDESLCDFIVPAKCISVDLDNLECIDAEDDLQSVLDKICDLITESESDNCPCPVSTYEIDTVCITGGDEGISFIQITATPNFSQTTPTYISISINDMVVTVVTNLIMSITEDTPITFDTQIYAIFVPSEDSFRIRIIDNQGNYSEEFEVDSIDEC